MLLPFAIASAVCTELITIIESISSEPLGRRGLDHGSVGMLKCLHKMAHNQFGKLRDM